MFQGISHTDYVPRGKSVSIYALESRKQNFTLGIKEWERPIGSIYQCQNTNRGFDPTKFKPPHPSTSQITMAHDHTLTNDKLKNHFSSETGKSFVKFPNTARTRPVLSTQDLTQSKFLQATLNHGFPYAQSTKSTSQASYDFKDPKQVPDIKWKPSREQLNPLTNEVFSKEKLEKASLFEFFNENRKKDRVSHNYSEIPKKNERIDTITGRRLPPLP